MTKEIKLENLIEAYKDAKKKNDKIYGKYYNNKEKCIGTPSVIIEKSSQGYVPFSMLREEYYNKFSKTSQKSLLKALYEKCESTWPEERTQKFPDVYYQMFILSVNDNKNS